MDYMNDVDCFKSYTNLRNQLFYKQKTVSKTVVPVVKIQRQSKPKKPSISLNDYKNDKSVLIAIQNDVRFINIIMNCRKQRSPIAYIFVESNLYVSCVIKNTNGYPLVFIRIPIDNIYAYANNTNNTYEFPIQGILSKDIKYTKNSAYTMLFKYDGQNVNFVYEVYNGDIEPNRIIINSVGTNNQSVINNIFKIDKTGLLDSVEPIRQLPGMLSQENENYLLSFYNMNIIILREVSDITSIIQFNQKQSAKTSNYFEIKDGQMNFISTTTKSHNEKYICSSSDSLIWADVVTSDAKCFNLMPYESLFKINYNKSITTNDKVYYAFTSYLDDYMFIKIITPITISENQPIKSFTKIFSKEYQILESYVCIKA